MNSINIHRLGKILRWSYVTDQPYLRKSLATVVGAFAFVYQVPNLTYVLSTNDHDSDFGVVVTVISFLIGLVMGSCYMLQSFRDNKDGLRDLFTLPASNIEKFLVRYLYSWVVQLVHIVISILVADGLSFVVSDVIRALSHPSVSSDLSGFSILMMCVWIHSFYMLGVNFFRNVKYGWAYTTLALLALFILFSLLVPTFLEVNKVSHLLLKVHTVPLCLVLLVLSIFNVWLAFRLFCNRQYIGKFVNWI